MTAAKNILTYTPRRPATPGGACKTSWLTSSDDLVEQRASNPTQALEAIGAAP